MGYKKLEKHRYHENREGCVKEALEHIEEPSKVPHSKYTYGKMGKLNK